MANRKDNSFFKEWLEKLQQESWQLELLISGFALFGIYGSQSIISEFDQYVYETYSGAIRSVMVFGVIILKVGWKIFFLNLLIHVVLRGLWIGAIGLRYVSGEIDYEALNYSKRFTSLLKNRVGEFDDFIEKLERICSVLFAYTFLLFLFFFSGVLFFVEVLLLFTLFENLLGEGNPLFLLVGILYFFIGLLVFLDFITLGLFKKIEEPSVSKIYSYIFKFYSYTTLSFLYSPLIYNFLDNKYTRRLFFFSVPYIMVMALSSNIFSTNNYNFFPPSEESIDLGHRLTLNSYDDLREEAYRLEDNLTNWKLPRLSINKFMNDEPYLKYFLKMRPGDSESISENTDHDPYFKEGTIFSLFRSDRTDVELENEIIKQLHAHNDSLRKERTKLRRKRRLSSSDIEKNAFSNSMDSIGIKIEGNISKLSKEEVKLKDLKLEEVKNAFLATWSLTIDEKEILDDSDCYYFVHANNSEKGVLCLYPMDSLSTGKHELYFEKKQTLVNPVNKSVSYRFEDGAIPFYKVLAN